MKDKTRQEAVSPVIGEALMIGLILLIIPFVSIAIMSELPGNRVPTVTILLDYDEPNLILYHKGGDYLVRDDITVIVRHLRGEEVYRDDGGDMTFVSDVSPDSRTFDLGDRYMIDTSSLTSPNEVRVVARNAVVFTGVIP
ncbi:MAG: type IV pilin [Methanospirillaceae archaeon]|nr:type IV pilin [Methanospirillaceae archaeon]